jgi:hypothetical protein
MLQKSTNLLMEFASQKRGFLRDRSQFHIGELCDLIGLQAEAMVFSTLP